MGQDDGQTVFRPVVVGASPFSVRDQFEAHVQRKAEQHLEACWEAEWDDAEESPAFAPFCGCTTCIVREVLMSVWEDMASEAGREALSESG
jgi:hypothetical protein